MWRNKKLIFIEVLAVVVLVAVLGVAAVAHADDESTSQVQDNTTSLMEQVAEIYQANTGTAIDPQELENAFVQARNQNRIEIRYQCLDKLVEQGKITQEQTDEFKAWLDARPDIFSEEFQQWLDSRPDIMGMFGQHEGGGMMSFGGRHNGGAGMGGGFGLQSHDCWSD
ncbi:MAG: hypothetical protein A2Y58_00120 [Chloroflexi bacterium RBG_13_51_52]|nr:MAG: hypothetical protein A2Y58_00120 [Chloroflexi bacterium RBG_13_51_52]